MNKPTENPAAHKEVFLSKSPKADSEAAAAGRLQRVARGLYTGNLAEPAERLIRRNWHSIAEQLFPGAVLIGRSATAARPTEDGQLFLDMGPARKSVSRRDVGPLRFELRPGPGPMEGDMKFGGLYIASRPRAAIENFAPSRDSANRRSWTLTQEELETWLDSIARTNGEDELNRIRDEARRIAIEKGGDWLNWSEKLSTMVGALLGTRQTDLVSSAARARASGDPIDGSRLELFELLRSELMVMNPRVPAEISDPNHAFAFFEAYFSNFVEGTEFEIPEAESIVFDGLIPEARPADAHDVLGTFKAIVSPQFGTRTPENSEELIEWIRGANAAILAERPEAGPGEFKTLANRAGNTSFVAPELVRGTLRSGWSYYDSLPPGFCRAVFAMFLVAEVHPFTDGNGRTARLLMNAELSADRNARFLTPISYRDDYLGALRALSRASNPTPLTRMVLRILNWVPTVDWTSVETATVGLEAANAFDGDSDARLRVP